MNKLEKWSEELTKEVYNEWKTKYSFWKSGFKIFYSPVRKNPKLLILSLNPGGTEEHFKKENQKLFENNDFSVSKNNEYLTTNYTMAKKVRKFFENNLDLLEESVVLPILFFRSKDYQYWKNNIKKEIRYDMENFSYTKIKEILDYIEPKFCLIIGFVTYDKIKKHILKIDFENTVSKNVKQNGEHRLYIKAKSGNIVLFCIPHLTGYHISNEKMNEIRREFLKTIN